MNLTDVPVLVTGGSGFVGSRIAAWLADEGATVLALVRRAGAHPGLESPRITQVEGDFTDPVTASRFCTGQVLVVHAAATISRDLTEALQVNVSGTGVLAAAARVAGCRRFIHVSTLSVYDFQTGAGSFDEDSPRRTLGKNYAHSPAASPFYGTTKAEGERALQEEMDRGLPATIFRLAAVLGVHPTSGWTVKVPAKVRDGQLALRGEGLDVLPWTHVDNVVHAIALSLDFPAAVGRAYNIVDGDVTWRDFVSGCAAAAGDSGGAGEAFRYFHPAVCRCPRARRTRVRAGAQLRRRHGGGGGLVEDGRLKAIGFKRWAGERWTCRAGFG